jgi:hypothetical protein
MNDEAGKASMAPWAALVEKLSRGTKKQGERGRCQSLASGKEHL